MEKQVVPEEVIENKIFLVRGQKCMLGNHLAKLYHVNTSALMQAVKRNDERFPADFMFELNRNEITRISQIVTSLKYSKNVYAFTEQGVAMLSSVLRSKRAIQVNIAIMRAFVKLKQILSTHKELAHKLIELEQKVSGQDAAIRDIFEAIRQLMIVPETPKRRIGFHTD